MAAKSNPSQYRTMTDIAKDVIREAILNNVYKPGTHLIPGKLEKELNLGKMAIREALIELSGSGLIASIPNVGSVVAEPFSPEEVVEVYEIRYLLEGKAAYIGAQNITENELRELEKLYKKMNRRSISIKDYFFVNKEFHMIIYRASGWERLCDLIIQLTDLTQAFRMNYQYGSLTEIPILNDDHHNILEALKKGQPAKVQELIVANLRNGFKGFWKLYQAKKGDSLAPPDRPSRS
jgi:DNA-binding GntR family transcriptional regulator